MRSFLQFGAVALLACSAAALCSAQSLGDVARAQQQKKAASSQPKPKHVITEDDIKSSSSSTADPFEPKSAAPRPSASSDDHAQSAAELQAKLKDQRERIAEVQASIKEIEKEMERWKTSDCTHVLYADTQQNACDIPQKLTADYDKAKEQLKAEQAKLEEIEDEARRQGYGSAFYQRTN